jgi:hypothetical protein
MIISAFLEDLRRLESVLERTEIWSYSPSLQFIYEGDGKVLERVTAEVHGDSKESGPAARSICLRCRTWNQAKFVWCSQRVCPTERRKKI